jgi:hypothetical protein
VPLHSNGSYSIVVCVFVDGGTCLSSSYLAMNVCSDSTIPAFGRHVTIFQVINIFIPLKHNSCESMIKLSQITIEISKNFLQSPIFKYSCFKHCILLAIQALKALFMNISYFQDITPCILVIGNRHFGGTYHLNLQGRRVSQARK